jgi:hypothetical protein
VLLATGLVDERPNIEGINSPEYLSKSDTTSLSSSDRTRRLTVQDLGGTAKAQALSDDQSLYDRTRNRCPTILNRAHSKLAVYAELWIAGAKILSAFMNARAEGAMHRRELLL